MDSPLNLFWVSLLRSLIIKVQFAILLLASLESVQFITNVLFARAVHKATITKRMLISTVAIIVGNVLVVIFSDHSASVYDGNQLLNVSNILL